MVFAECQITVQGVVLGKIADGLIIVTVNSEILRAAIRAR